MNVDSAFKFLNISEAATAEEVNASYRRLLKEYHPDRNKERTEWSHQMTVRLTEAFTAVSLYLQNKPEIIETTKTEPDSGYSLAMQARIASLYDLLLEHLHNYYNKGMNNLYLREEGVLRHHFKATLYRLEQTISRLRHAQEWPGSAVQHHQAGVITNFATTFYENMLIKPKEQELLSNIDLKAEKLYYAGTSALDTSIKRGVLALENTNGLICPGNRYKAEKNFMLLLANYSESSYIPETLIKLSLLKSLSALCEYLETTL